MGFRLGFSVGLLNLDWQLPSLRTVTVVSHGRTEQENLRGLIESMEWPLIAVSGAHNLEPQGHALAQGKVEL